MSEQNPTRRRVLRGIGVSTLASGGLAISGAAKTPKNEVTQKSGQTEDKILRKAKKNHETRRLLDYVGDSGWTIDTEDTAVMHVQPRQNDGKQYYLVVATLRKVSGETTTESRALVWNNNPGSNHEAVIQVLNSSESTEGRYYVEKDTVKADIDAIGESESAPGDVSTDDNLPGGGGGSNECLYVHEYCSNPNWTCLAGIAVAYGSCAALTVESGFSTWVLCLGGAGVPLMQAMDDEHCSVCDDVDVRTLDVCGEEWQISPP